MSPTNIWQRLHPFQRLVMMFGSTPTSTNTAMQDLDLQMVRIRLVTAYTDTCRPVSRTWIARPIQNVCIDFFFKFILIKISLIVYWSFFYSHFEFRQLYIFYYKLKLRSIFGFNILCYIKFVNISNCKYYNAYNYRSSYFIFYLYKKIKKGIKYFFFA